VPLNLIGSARRGKSGRRVVGFALFGPNAEHKQKMGDAGRTGPIAGQGNALVQMKDSQGKPISIDALVTQTVLGEAPVDLGWVEIKRLRPNVFQFTPAAGAGAGWILTPLVSNAPPIRWRRT